MSRVLVTGGGGFLGQAIVRQLRADGVAVVSFSRSRYPELEALGAELATGDLADGGALDEAAAGCDGVIHVAAKAGIWGPADAYHRANVLGTENVLRACRTHKIRRLVHTSSPSVVFHGEDQENVDETASYPDRFLAHYPRTKAVAERIVLEANGAELSTVALRPHLIWGPRDNHLVPRILARARAGQLRMIHPEKWVDCCYVDNAASAHVLALNGLAPDAPMAGKAYFISQGEPIPIGELINRILEAGGLPPVTRTVPAGVAYAAGCVFEGVHRLFGIEREPRMTRFLARQLSTAHWFDIGAARRDLGYHPRITIDDGMTRLAEWLRQAESSEGKVA